MAEFKLNPPRNRLIGDMPKIGIRPTIDGRRKGVRESLEKTTMTMARNVARLIESTLRHPCGLPVECVVADHRRCRIAKEFLQADRTKACANSRSGF